MTDSEFPYQTETAVQDALDSGHVPADHPALESHEGRHAAQEGQEDQDPGTPEDQDPENPGGMTPATPAP